MREGWKLQLWYGYLDTVRRKGRKQLSYACGGRNLPSTLPDLDLLDISIFSHMDNEDLIEHINRVGKVFYEKG